MAIKNGQTTAPLPEASTDSHGESAATLGMTILVVDDEKGMLFLLEGFLRQCGYDNVLTARSAAKAYKVLEEASQSPDSRGIDLILLDVNMPGVNGVEACRHIKRELGYSDVAVIMVTGVDDSEVLSEAFAAGAMDYVNKPIDRLELDARVNSALAIKRANDFQKLLIAQLTDKQDELSEALENVKVLRGLLPICSSCKKIRNDQGYWDVMEAYITAHSDATFSHGICPVCVNKQYPQVYDKIKTRLTKQR